MIAIVLMGIMNGYGQKGIDSMNFNVCISYDDNMGCVKEYHENDIIDDNCIENNAIYVKKFLEHDDYIYLKILLNHGCKIDSISYNNVSYHFGLFSNEDSTTAIIYLNLHENDSKNDLKIYFGKINKIKINEFSENTVKIYPNPATNVIHFKINDACKSVTIYDMQGKMIKILSQNDLSNDELNVSSLKPGMYFIKISNFNKSIITKFIKQ